MDLSSALIEILRKKSLEKELLGDLIEFFRKTKLVKIGRKYVRPWDYTDLIGKERPIEKAPYIIKLATRLERGKLLIDPVLYSQGVLGLSKVKLCDTLEGVKFLSQVYARDQMNPIYVNELLLIIPSSCANRLPDSHIRILGEFFDSLRKGENYELIRLVPRIHAQAYDKLIAYIKELGKKYRYILKYADEETKERIKALVEQKARTKFDRIRALVRSCQEIEIVYSEVKNV